MKPRSVLSTLTARAVLVTGLVAVISVVITAAVALPVTVRSANDDARAGLAGKANIAANAIEGRDTVGAAAREDARARKVAQTLRGEGIETVLISNGRPDQAGLPAAGRGRGGGRISGQPALALRGSADARGGPAGRRR